MYTHNLLHQCNKQVVHVNTIRLSVVWEITYIICTYISIHQITMMTGTYTHTTTVRLTQTSLKTLTERNSTQQMHPVPTPPCYAVGSTPDWASSDSVRLPGLYGVVANWSSQLRNYLQIINVVLYNIVCRLMWKNYICIVCIYNVYMYTLKLLLIAAIYICYIP